MWNISTRTILDSRQLGRRRHHPAPPLPAASAALGPWLYYCYYYRLVVLFSRVIEYHFSIHHFGPPPFFFAFFVYSCACRPRVGTVFAFLLYIIFVCVIVRMSQMIDWLCPDKKTSRIPIAIIVVCVCACVSDIYIRVIWFETRKWTELSGYEQERNNCQIIQMRLGAMHQGGDDDDVTLLFYLQTPLE